MKISKNQLNKIICEYLEIQNYDQVLNEGITGTTLVKELVSLSDLSDEKANKLKTGIDLMDDMVTSITPKALDDWIIKSASSASKLGLMSGAKISASVAGAGVGLAIISAYSIVPNILINTINNLSTVEEKLRNVREGYEGLRNNKRAARVQQYGMDLEDTDFDSPSVTRELSKNLGIKQYGSKELITHLAAESIKIDGDKVKMKNDAVVLKLQSEGVLSYNFVKLVKEEFKRIRSEIKDAPIKLKKEFYALILKKAKEVKGKPNAGKTAIKDIGSVGFNLIFPEAKNIAGLVFNAAVEAAA